MKTLDISVEEVYIDRLKRLPTIIEMPYNDVVQKFIDRYSGKLRRSVSFMLGASNFYMPIFEEALEAYNLPLELKYLPVIESALNPKAVSRVGATGLWQFMLPTGKRYGLEVNSLVDERRDPVKASYAAAHYLSDLYKIFDDWGLGHRRIQLWSKQGKPSHPPRQGLCRLLEHLSLPAKGDPWICTSIHRSQLYHELLLRPQHLSDGHRVASQDRHRGSRERSYTWSRLPRCSTSISSICAISTHNIAATSSMVSTSL